MRVFSGSGSDLVFTKATGDPKNSTAHGVGRCMFYFYYKEQLGPLSVCPVGSIEAIGAVFRKIWGYNNGPYEDAS